MTVSEFSQVSPANASRLALSLERRSTARLYTKYRRVMYDAIAQTQGLVIDVGAGIGHLVATLAHHHPSRVVIGVEPSYDLTKVATQNSCNMVVATGSALPIPSQHAGCVVAERVLQHVHDVDTVVSEMVRICSLNGTVVCVDPDHARVKLHVPPLQDLANRLVKWRSSEGLASPQAPSETANVLARHGFAVEQMTLWCTTNRFDDARCVANFPEWANLAAPTENIPQSAIDEWETYWDIVRRSPVSPGEWFSWPIVVTIASRSPVVPL